MLERAAKREFQLISSANEIPFNGNQVGTQFGAAAATQRQRNHKQLNCQLIDSSMLATKATKDCK